MRIPGKKLVRTSARWLRSRFIDHAFILGYHRIAVEPQDPFSLCVSPENFYEHMEVLRNNATPLALDELTNALKAGNLPKRGIAITFDDGYADILYNAKPILDELNIPATVFAVSGYLGREFWWEELVKMIMDVRNINGELTLRNNTHEFRWEMSDQMDNAKRYSVLISIYRALRSLPETLRQEQLEQIRKWVNVDSELSVSGRSLTSDELGSLIQGGLVDIGAHGKSHTDLAVLSPNQWGPEIAKCKDDLEEIIGKPVRSFSYPNGSFTQEIKEKVMAAKYQCACTSNNDIVWRGSDFYSLSRFWIPDVNGRQFHRWLQNWD